MMLSGIDISRHNKNFKDPLAFLKYDFVIFKASEGYGYKDTYLRNYMNVYASSEKKPLIGFYHYARPEINSDPTKEAKHFVETIKPYLKYNPVLALDVEDKALKVNNLDGWCQLWAFVVEQIIGVKPMIYCSAAETTRFKKCASYGCGLWVAKWADKISKKDIKPWEFWAIWQNSASHILSGVRVDTDVFNGTREQFLKYAEVSTDGKKDDQASDNATAGEAL